VLEDYYECLHHKKEVSQFQLQPTLLHHTTHLKSYRTTYQLTPLQAARTLALQAAYRKAEANIKRDDAPSAGEIRRLGVLDAPLEEKNLKPSKWFPHKEIN
jgi:NADH dehydrogenase (ubiquinone) Fe-S protein 5